MTDLRQSSTYATFMKKRGWIVEKVASTSNSSNKLFLYIKNIPWLPISVAKLQRFEKIPDFQVLKNIVRKYRVVSLTLEPGNIPNLTSSQLEKGFIDNGFKKSRSPFLPTKTVQIDLTKLERVLFSEMKKDARMSISKAKRNCKIRIISQHQKNKIKDFYSFWKRNGKGYIPSFSEFSLVLNIFRENAFLTVVYRQGQTLAGAVILTSPENAYYYYAFTSSKGRGTFSGYLVVWEAMREARRRKCKTFDLEGVYDDRFTKLKRWKGFTLFKKKFGGEVVEYPAVYTRNFLPF